VDNTLFTSLRKYKTVEGKDPVENFITEAFTWILKNYPEFSSYYLARLSEKLNHNSDFSKHEWDTQVNFNGVFPDLVCKMVGNVAYVFEHKARAHLHPNQLENYRKVAQDKFTQYKIILVSGDVSQHAQNPDLSLCWRDVYRWIEEWMASKKEDNNLDLFIFDSFINLLDNEGLGPVDAITHESILYFLQSRHFLRDVRNLINIVHKTEIVKLNSLTELSDFKLIEQDQWGRIGFGLPSNLWRPGIFIGIMAEWEDHRISPILGDKSPDFVIIISFSQDLHNEYPNDSDFIKLVNELSAVFEKEKNGWKFYNHLNDRKVIEKNKINKWHPLYIRKPMIEVFRGTKTNEDQVKRFMDCANEVLPIVLKSEHFINLRTKYKQ